MHLKRAGSYICRTLSYAGCTFETIEDAVATDLLSIYDASARVTLFLSPKKHDFNIVFVIKALAKVVCRASDWYRLWEV